MMNLKQYSDYNKLLKDRLFVKGMSIDLGLTEKQRGFLEKFFPLEIKEKIINNEPVLTEIHDADLIRRLTQERMQIYQESEVREPLCDGKDLFDRAARFFVLHDSHKKNISKVIRAVDRNYFGIIPTELNGKTGDELHNFYDSFEYNTNGDLKESSLSLESRQVLQDFIMNHQRKIYEPGGFFSREGFERDKKSHLVAIMGIAQVVYTEQWDAVIQTHHPKHTEIYLNMSFPYRILDHFTDFCSRPAATLYLDGAEFRQQFDYIKDFFKKDSLH